MTPDLNGGPLIRPFPRPRASLRLAYAELDRAAHGTPEQKAALGSLSALARPWLPDSLAPDARADLWIWLDQFVLWLNHEYAFDPSEAVPACWLRHPQLINELAVLVDQRFRAGTSLTSDAMEDWHRYALPAFLDRLRGRLSRYCLSGEHQRWPSQAAYDRLCSELEARDRRSAFEADLRERGGPLSDGETSELRLVNLQTGEIAD